MIDWLNGLFGVTSWMIPKNPVFFQIIHPISNQPSEKQYMILNSCWKLSCWYGITPWLIWYRQGQVILNLVNLNIVNFCVFPTSLSFIFYRLYIIKEWVFQGWDWCQGIVCLFGTTLYFNKLKNSGDKTITSVLEQ